MAIKPLGKALIIAAVVGAGIYGFSLADSKGYFKQKPTISASVPDKFDLGAAAPAAPVRATVTQVSLSSASSDYTAKVLTIAWNATMGLHYANGDVVSSPDSLMAKHGVKLALERQDDYSQMLTQQVAFAKQVAEGNPKPTDGAAFVVIMGDGYPAYIAGAQEAMKKLGQQLEVVGSLGYSRGEDKCMLPPDSKVDPSKARGSLIGAVIRDGDWNICMKWAADNGIPVNPDEKTYDPDAMNFVSVNAFTEADEKLITGYCEDRKVVHNGKPTGNTQHVCQNGTATWTPGDVNVARKKGGVIAVASTREYMWQMPAVIIGNKQWMAQNPAFVENMLAAALEGGEAVRNDDSALTKAAEVEAKVYKEESADYWKKYFKGVTEQDRTGQVVSLGGSTTSGLADNAFLFGLNGNDNLYKRVYTVFGGIDHKYYPDVMPTVIPYDQVVNTSYLQALLSKATVVAQADKPTFSETAPVTGTFAKRSYSIEFESGKATFTPTAVQTLNDLLNNLSISGLSIQINGHTDSVGSSMTNLQLSKQRADAVKAWLVANASSSFPAERIRTRGFGDTVPVADNHSAEGRAKNRRVEIVLLSTN
jgi:outer membrane protein OmpA-like peptidoglycan-associated protein